MSISSRPELNMHLRHDFIFVLNKSLTETQLKAISTDLELLKYNCAVRKNKEDNWVLLVGLNNEQIFLEAAEQEMIMCKW